MVTRRQQWIGIVAVIAVIGLGAIALAPTGDAASGNIAVLSISGMIGGGGGLGQQPVTPDSFRDLLEQAERRSPAAYLIEISSPGGSVVASKRLSEEIQEIEEPTACVMGASAMSGAYWAALGCDRIIADRLTLTGSIGATMGYLEYSGLLEQYGIEYVNLTSGAMKDMGVPYKNLTATERKVFERLLSGVEDAFVQRVAQRRNMSVDRVRQLANGTIFLGSRAAELGLIDAVGGQEEAIRWLENRTGQNLTTVEISAPQQFSALSLLARHMGYGIGAVIEQRLLSARNGPQLRSIG